MIVGDVDPERGARPGRGALRATCRAGRAERATPLVRRAAADGPARLHARSSPKSAARGLFGWHTVPRGHPDGPALDVLSDLLTCGRRSRLWDALVEREQIATWVETAQEGARRAGQFLLQVEAAPERRARHGSSGRSPTTLGRLADDGPTAEELARSRHRLEAAWRWEQEDLAGPGRRARARRALGRLAGLAGRAPRGPGRRGRRHPPRRLDLPDRLEPDGRLVAARAPSRSMTVLLPAETRPRRCPARVAHRPSRPSVRSRWPFPPAVSKLADYRPQRDGPAQRPAARLRAPAGDRDRRARAVRRRRPAPRGEAGPGLPDRPAARGGDADPLGRGAGRGDRGRRRHARGRLDRRLAPGPRRGPAPGARAPGRRRPPPGLPRRGARLGEAADRRRAAGRPRRPGLPRRPDLPRPGLRRPPLRPRPARLGPRARPADARRRPRASPPALRPRQRLPRRRRRLRAATAASLVKTHFRSWAGPGRTRCRPLPRPVRRRGPGSAAWRIPASRSTSCSATWASRATTPTSTPWPCSTTSSAAARASPTGSAGSSATRWGWPTRSAAGSPTRPTSCRACSGSTSARCPTRPTASSRRSSSRSAPMHAGAFSDDEVDRARRYLAGSWVFDFQTVEQRAERLLELERWGLGLDEPIRWPERIAADHPPPGPPRRPGPPRPLGPGPRRVRPDPPPRPARRRRMRLSASELRCNRAISFQEVLHRRTPCVRPALSCAIRGSSGRSGRWP